MQQIHDYLYFPNCKITKAEYLPGYPINFFVMTIKSLEKNPEHYPKHFTLEGKSDFIFRLPISSIDYYKSNFDQIFTKKINKKEDLKNMIGAKISVIAFFDPNANIKLSCVGFGVPFDKPYIYNNNYKKHNEVVETAYLNYSLGAKSNKKTKKQKI